MFNVRRAVPSASTSARLISKIKEDCVEIRDCWKCRKAIDCLKEKYFCPTCAAIQPAEGRNFFEYLGVDPSFDVDIPTVKRNFLKLQTKIHPDKFSKCSSEEKHISELCSSYLNEAYRTLTEPLRRAKYLLKLKGAGAGTEDDGASNAATSSSFLVEMMELNEEVDSLDSEHAIQTMLRSLEERIDELCQSFKSRFEGGDLQGAKEAVLKMGFYYRVKSNLIRKLHAL